MADLPDLSGRTIVVTGASSGIGAATAAQLAKVNGRVVLAVRDVTKGARVARSMRGDIEVRGLRLDDLDSVRSFAADWTGPLDILINNAGVMMVDEGRTADGFERQIGTNHLGPFALTNLLLHHITDRIVTVSSNAHARGRVDLADLLWQSRAYQPSQAYSDSKLANLLFTFELQRRLTASGSSVRAMAVHPGMIRTNLFAHASGGQAALIKGIGRFLLQPPEAGARSTLFAATQDIPGGSFVQPGGFARLRGAPEVSMASSLAYDLESAATLWELSARLTGRRPGKREGEASAPPSREVTLVGDTGFEPVTPRM